ncbi:MAG: glycosyl transferase, family 2 [Gemmatimonadetes bacterium]|nr:glycosyl transferase, family 2 [Gemmatimonadota bacterium]
MTPAISVIIVTWTGWGLLDPMLRSLYATASADGVPVEVLIVDNGSTDDTIAQTAHSFPSAHVIPLGRNTGFAYANNRAAEQASAPLIALINNDVLIEPGYFAAVVRAADAHPEFDVFATQMLMLRRPGVVDNRGLFPSIVGHLRQRDAGQARVPERPSQEEFGASGGACVVRRSLLRQIGLFDESLGSYHEDVDFAQRARAADARCWYVHEAVVLHHGSATASAMPEWKFEMLTRNMSVMRRRWLRPWQFRWWVSRGYVAVQGARALRARRFGAWRQAIRSARDVRPSIAGYPAS